MRPGLALAVAGLLLACSGESKMPPGFQAACYGAGARDTLAVTHPVYSATLGIAPSSRPDLRDALFRLAADHGLEAFDDGAHYGDAFFSVYLCSRRGALAIVDSRGVRGGGVRITVFAYRSAWQPGPFIEALRADLSSTWPEALEEKDVSDTMIMNSLL